jgi:hypothetical protein
MLETCVRLKEHKREIVRGDGSASDGALGGLNQALGGREKARCQKRPSAAESWI